MLGKAFRAAVLAGAMAGLSACGGPERVTADDAWIRLPAAPGRPGAAYFTLHGGRSDATLIDVSADVAVRAEMHESMSGAGGMAAMKPLASVPVPAGAKVVFAPGGKHVMLFDLGPRVAAGQRVPLKLSFAGGKTIEVQAMVVGAGDPAPKE